MDGGFEMKAVIAYSHSGDDVKAYDNGMMTKELHIKGLLAVMNAFNPGHKFPEIVSTHSFSIMDIENKETRRLAWEVWGRARILSLFHNAGHQVGAMGAILQAMEAAIVMEAEYMLFYGDDIIPARIDDAEYRLKRIEETGVDWSSTKFAENCPVNTMVFVCKPAVIRPILDCQAFASRLSDALIKGYVFCIEQYVAQCLTDTKCKVDITGGGQDYGHVHDPIRLLKELDEYQKRNEKPDDKKSI